MASSNPKEEIQAFGVGMDLRSLDKGAGNGWVQNLFRINNQYLTRDGAGTLAQYGTTLNGGRATDPGQDRVYGYGELLGTPSTPFITNQGHSQIITAHQLVAYTAELQVDSTQTWVAGQYGQVVDNLVAINVYDITTDTRQEFVLIKGTDEVSVGRERLPKLQPHYQTQVGRDLSSWYRGTTSRATFFQIGDRLYIVLAGLGVWVYTPIDSGRDTLNRQITNTLVDESYIGEPCALRRLNISDGFFSEFAYISKDEFPLPVAACNYQNRAVYASGRYIYFSDPDYPNHIMADNVQGIPCDREIKAIGTVKGVIIICTDTETFLYQPSTGTSLVSGGRVYNLSKTRGCLSPSAMLSANDMLFWVDKQGVCANAGGTEILFLSEQIDPWFSQVEEIQNPLTNYQTASGLTTLADEQPRARINLSAQLNEAKLAWNSCKSILYCTLKDITLVWQKEGGWSVWLYESSAVTSGGTALVGITKNIEAPWLVCQDEKVYLVGGPDQTAYVADDSAYTVQDRSFYICQLGRGGALDRSSCEQENRRAPSGQYIEQAGLTGVPTFFIGPGVKMPDGWKTGNQTTTEEVWLLPIYCTNPAPNTVADYSFIFRIDTNHWRVLVKPAAADGEIDYMLPTERALTNDGFGFGLGEVTAYDSGTGLASDNGNEVRIFWDGAAAPNTWRHHPNLNLPVRKAPLIYIPVIRYTGGNTQTVLSVVTSVQTATFNTLGAPVLSNAYYWTTGDYPEQSLANDAVAQPVDWAIKSPTLGDGTTNLKCRGQYARLRSQGDATTKFVVGWPWGVLNSVTAADDEDFAGQRGDWTNTPPGISEQDAIVSNEARLLVTNAVQPVLKVGNGSARWSSTGNPGTGNLLIDDAAVDTVAISESVRGETISTMLFGTLNHPAEKLTLQQSKLIVRAAGGRRRQGR